MKTFSNSKRRPGLFSRTFLLLMLLLLMSTVGWMQTFRLTTEVPYCQGVAQHIVTTTNLTRHSLVTVDPLWRVALLHTLAQEEGLVASPRNASDVIKPLPGDSSNQLIESLVKDKLGQDTVIASSVNGVRGLWVSMDLEGDPYWLQTSDGLLAPSPGRAGLWWGIATVVLSFFGASLLVKHVIEPLKQLSGVAKKIGRGQIPEPLPEDVSTAEIHAVNQSFNHMVQDLKRTAEDRVVLLSGLSHDLRTPMTRMMLEVEMADLSDDTRSAMRSDLEQMENIVSQFSAFARSAKTKPVVMNIGEAVQIGLDNTRFALDPSITIETDIVHDAYIVGNPEEFPRVIQNLCTNAKRYGRSEDGHLRLHVKVETDGRNILLSFADEGPGIPPEERERVMRPFERGDAARTGVTGSGLGLAILDKIVRPSGGQVQLCSAEPHGLLVKILFPAVRPGSKTAARLENTPGAL